MIASAALLSVSSIQIFLSLCQALAESEIVIFLEEYMKRGTLTEYEGSYIQNTKA